MNTRVTNITRQGFTLIELMIVAAAVSVLLSLWYPSMKKMMVTAMGIECQNNLRRMMTATHFYADDHAGYFPYYNRAPPPKVGRLGDVWWRSPMAPYYSSIEVQYKVQVCPTSSEKWFDGNRQGFTYSINRFVSCDVNLRVRPGAERISDFKAMVETVAPSQTMAFLDGQEYRLRAGYQGAGIARYAIGGGLRYEDPDMIHDHGLNAAFVDGHTEWLGSEVFYGYTPIYESAFWSPHVVAR